MTDTERQRLPWYRYLGPWPMQPAISFFILFAWFSAVGTGAQLTDGSQAPNAETALAVIPLSAPVALAGTAVLVVGMWWQGRHGVHVLGYLVTLVVAALAMTGVRYLTFPFDRVVLAIEPTLLLVGVRSLIVLVLIHAVSGAVTWRLTEQVHQTRQALDLARRQQFDLVRADEEVRQQMATLLHDQVQSSLIAICLRLRSLTGRVSDEDRALLIDAVDRLEDMRALDVRTAVRRLSPSLDEVDLQSAIVELASTYEPTVVVDVTVEADVDNSGIDSQVRLAAYRIIEQALMNAVLHGGADHITVMVTLTGGAVDVVVEDNGVGLPDPNPPEGMGLLLISTWARALNGTWSLRTTESGARLEAELPSQL